MLWSTLRTIINSKAYWSLNFLFFLIPLLARLRVPIDIELFGLYVAAWLLLVGGLLFSIAKPELSTYETFDAFKGAGRDSHYLSSTYIKARGVIAEVDDGDTRTRLENASGNEEPHPSVFWFVCEHVDKTGKIVRWTLSVLLLLAAALLLAVNVARFVRVSISTFSPTEFKMATTKSPLPIGFHMSVGGTVDVTHEDGKGGTTKTSGELIDSDDHGYVVIRTDGGKLIYIPKGRVVNIIRDAH